MLHIGSLASQVADIQSIGVFFRSFFSVCFCDDNLYTYTGILVGASLSGTYECIGHSPGRWQVTIR
jgi:hypothetical protein